jgi:hypothetical protein
MPDGEHRAITALRRARRFLFSNGVGSLVPKNFSSSEQAFHTTKACYTTIRRYEEAVSCLPVQQCRARDITVAEQNPGLTPACHGHPSHRSPLHCAYDPYTCVAMIHAGSYPSSLITGSIQPQCSCYCCAASPRILLGLVLCSQRQRRSPLHLLLCQSVLSMLLLVRVLPLAARQAV